MARTIRIRGTGRVTLAAYGMQDAEHQVEKEIRRSWPEARVEVLEVGRAGVGRIVEEFEVGYRISASIEVDGEEKEAPSLAFRVARARLAGTRYERTGWERLP